MSISPVPEEYAMYLRKSRSDEYGEPVEEVLHRHEKTLTALAKQQNLTIGKIYREVVSGETIASRPEVQNLLRDVEQGMWKGVIVMEIERLARGDAVDQGIMQRTFFITNTKIITPMKIYDPQNEFDEEYFEYGLFRSRSEYKTIKRRINQGRQFSVREGKWIASTAPYGYARKKLEKERGYSLEIVPEEAEVVKTIFDLYTNGRDGEIWGAGKISNYLDAMDIHPRTSRFWSPASIRDMLKNPAYIGKVAWGKEKDVKYVEDGQIKTRRIKQDDYILVDGRHEAIIDQKSFETAQRMMKSNTKKAQGSTNINTSLKNPLSGLVYCEKCGTLMTRLGPNHHSKHDTLRCQNRHCDNVSAPIYAIEEEIIFFLNEWIKDESLLITADDTQKENISKRVNIIPAQIDSTSNDLSELELQKTKIYEFLEKGLYTEEIFLERFQTITKQIEHKKKTLNTLQKKLSQLEAHEKKRKQWLPDTVRLIEAYDFNDTAQARNNVLRQLIERVTYLKTEKNHRGTLDKRNFTLRILPKINPDNAD